MPLYPALVPTRWLSLLVASDSFLPVKFPPEFPKVVYPPPPGATMPLSCDCPPRSPSHLHILQILFAKQPTDIRLPVISLCSSYPTTLPPCPAKLPPWELLRSRPLAVALIYRWSVEKNMYVLLLPPTPLPPKVAKSQLQKVVPLLTTSCITLMKPCVPPLPISAVSSTYPNRSCAHVVFPYCRPM